MSKELLTIELEGLPPTVNHLYRSTSTGRRYKTSAGLDYQQLTANAIIEAWGDKPPYTGNIELRLTFLTSNNRRWDIDNRVKAIQDCLSMAGVILDDRQVITLHVERHYGTATKTILTVMEARKNEEV